MKLSREVTEENREIQVYWSQGELVNCVLIPNYTHTHTVETHRHTDTHRDTHTDI